METIQLTHPIEADGGTVSALQLRRPVVRDMLAADKTAGSEAEKEVRMFASLCEVTPGVIEALDLTDYMALQETYRGFLSSARVTPGGP